MKQNPPLYSTALPLFLLLLKPASWLYILPLNLAVCALALHISLKSMEKAQLLRPMCKRELPLGWITGFAGDMAGAGLLLGLTSIPGAEGGAWAASVQGVLENPFRSTNSLLMVFIAIIVAAVVKYVLNLWVVFRKSGLDPREKRLLCVYMAMLTAPYTFLLPAFLLGFLA